MWFGTYLTLHPPFGLVLARPSQAPNWVYTLLDWHLLCKSTSQVWSAPSEGMVKLNIDGCSLGSRGQLGIGGVIRDRWGLVIKAYANPADDSFAIEAEVVEFLKGLVQAKALD